MAFWRILSVVGIALVLVESLISSIGSVPLQYRSLYWFLFAVVLLPVVIRWVFPVAWRALIQNSDLLVPFGVAWVATRILVWLTHIPVLGQLFVFGWQGSVLGLGLTLTVFALLNLFIWSAFACWQMDLIWQWARQGSLIDISPWQPIRRGIWIAAAILVFGNGVLLAALIPAIPMGLVGFFIVGIVGGLVWNLMTVALLPIALSGSVPFPQSVKEGIQSSWRLKHKWWIQLGVQLCVLGMVTCLAASYRDGGTTHSDWSFRVGVFWVGAFENNFRWHDNYMTMIRVNPLPVVAEMFEMMFILLAISMKMHVTKALHDNETDGNADAKRDVSG